MGCRNFLKTASGFAVPAAGMGTGISRVFAQVPSFPSKETAGNSTCGNPMEYRRLGGLEVAAIGLGCLPMVGYYGGKYDKREMIALIRRAHAICPIIVVQGEYAIGCRKPETKIFTTCSYLGAFV